jgi:hypothetical protein
MALYEVAILEVPNKKEQEDGAVEKLAFGPVFVVASEPQAAALRAIMDNPEKAATIDKSKMQVLVRPFV